MHCLEIQKDYYHFVFSHEDVIKRGFIEEYFKTRISPFFVHSMTKTHKWNFLSSQETFSSNHLQDESDSGHHWGKKIKICFKSRLSSDDFQSKWCSSKRKKRKKLQEENWTSDKITSDKWLLWSFSSSFHFTLLVSRIFFRTPSSRWSKHFGGFCLTRKKRHDFLKSRRQEDAVTSVYVSAPTTNDLVFSSPEASWSSHLDVNNDSLFS